MTRQLPTAPTVTRDRRIPRWPWPRTHVISARPVRTDVVVVAPAEYRNLAANPNAEILSTRVLGHTRVRVIVRYVDRTASTLPPRQLPVRFEGGRRWAFAMAVILGLPAVAAGTALALWTAYGDSVMAMIKVGATIGGTVLGLLALAWLLSAKAGICPGLHCPGCPHQH